MTIFRTVVEIQKADFDINFKSKQMFLGSCFTENIGNKFLELSFKTDLNPFGIIYNPVSVLNSIEFLHNGKLFDENDLEYSHEQWFSFFHHSRFSFSDKNQCLNNINNRISYSSEFLKNTDFLFLTFGSALTYVLLKTGQTVSNCHKIPSKEFEKKLLSVDYIIAEYSDFINKIQFENPKLKIIFTVSPIRHWKDGAIENMHSKSILLVAIHKLIKKFENIYYFPSYEIMMDELRDYRFYNDEMFHPSQVALNYIWERFSETYFTEETKSIISEIEKLLKAKSHRPFNPNSESYSNFIKSNIEKICNLESKYSFLDLNKMKSYFNSLR
jgi:hypothetical protein